MSDLENELLDLAGDDSRSSKKRRVDKAKSQAYIDDSDEEGEEEMDMDMEDMDMDLESEEGEDEDYTASKPAAAGSSGSKKSGPGVGKAKVRTAPSKATKEGNPYPLEGKYIDEDDRDELEGMPEIDREAILANRLEEMQKFKDSQQLDAMYKMAGMGGAEEDDDEEGSSRKKRKHTSVTKEVSRAIKDLKSKRKAMDERVQRRAARRERRPRSVSPSEASEEDGEISAHPSGQRRDTPEPAISPQARRSSPKRGEADLDALPAGCAEVNGARLSRYELVDMMFKDGFEETAAGAYVRLMAAERDADGRPKYRIHRISSVSTDHKLGRYSIEYMDRTIMDDRALLCTYGKAKRLFRIADVSNSDFQEPEFTRFSSTNRVDGIKAPKRSELKRKHDQIKALRDRPMTNEEISRQVEARKKSNPMAQRNKTMVQLTSLVASKNLAVRRNDHNTIEDLDRQIIALGGDPNTGELITMDAEEAKRNASEYDERIRKINENAKRKTKEAHSAAHAASIAQKRAQEAIIRSRQTASNSPAPQSIPKPVIPPASGLRKGETPQQYVARTVQLDLGDF